MERLSFSVIIPVYNVIAFLERCVESVLCQNYPMELLQILLIDDGSTDGSGELADRIAAGSDNVMVLHKENGGLSDARNYGLKHATGDYIILLDSDDYISPTTCSDFAVAITAQRVFPDIVTGTTIKHVGDRDTLISRKSTDLPMMTGKEFLTRELQGGKFFVAAWASVYRNEFLKDHHLCFWKGMLHEDEDFTPRALLEAESVLSTDIAFYHYIIRENSITTKKDHTRNAICIFEICRSLTRVFENIDNSELRALLKTHLAKIMINVTCKAELYRKERKYIIDYRVLKKNSVCISEKVRYVILRISPRLLCMITNWWRQ